MQPNAERSFSAVPPDIRECESVLCRAAEALEMIAHNGVGLGEVLQDYACQTGAQLRRILAGETDDLPQVLRSARSVLEMTPSAMRRNKAETLGEKERLTAADIGGITQEFLQSPLIARLLAEQERD